MRALKDRPAPPDYPRNTARSQGTTICYATPRCPISRLLPRRLPGAHAAPQVLPLGKRAVDEGLAEQRRGRFLQLAPKRVRKELRQLLGLQAAIGLDPPDRLGLGGQRITVAEGVED